MLFGEIGVVFLCVLAGGLGFSYVCSMCVFVRVFDGADHCGCVCLGLASLGVVRVQSCPSATASQLGRTREGAEMMITGTIRQLAGWATGVAVVVAGMGAPTVAATRDGGLTQGWVSAETGAPVDVSDTPACEDEGQEYGPCLWDAASAGDRRGTAFLVEEDGSVTYLRRADGSATATPVKPHKEGKPSAARAYPGWVWTGRTAPVTTPGLPACADVHGQETCTRLGYTLVVDQSACTQRIITDQGDEYVPGPAVAQALSDSCQAHEPDRREHEDRAGLSGARSTGDVHSAAPSAAVESAVEIGAPGRGDAAVDTVGSSPAAESVAVPAPSGTADSFDAAVGLVALALLAGGLWWGMRRSRPRRRVGRHGGRRW